MCRFMKNGYSAKQPQAALHAGGGGLVIEANDVTSQSFCTISNSNFTSNTASNGYFFYLSPTINPSGYFGLGRGGGISVVFRGRAANNTVQIERVQLEKNMAQFGGGMYLAFYGSTSNNNVTVVNSEMVTNTALSAINISTSGGGVFMELVGRKATYPFNNTVAISSCKFTSNMRLRKVVVLLLMHCTVQIIVLLLVTNC